MKQPILWNNVKIYVEMPFGDHDWSVIVDITLWTVYRGRI